MAKTPKPKKAKSTSIHSRAARRASSPSIDVDKSLKNLTTPVESLHGHSSFLSIHHGAGITKKKGKGKPMKRQQRLRQKKCIEKAEAVLDKIEKKSGRSTIKAKVVKERSATWDELNGKIQGKKLKRLPKADKEDEWEDEDTIDRVGDDNIVDESSSMEAPLVKPDILAVGIQVEGDEIL